MNGKALEDLLLEEELVEQIALQKRIDDVSIAYMRAYGEPYVPHFVINAIPMMPSPMPVAMVV